MTESSTVDIKNLSGLRVGVYHPWLKVGGSECTAYWSAIALHEAGADVTLLGPDTASLSSLNEAFGASTKNSIGDKGIKFAPLPVKQNLRLTGYSGYLRHFDQVARQTVDQFDLVISAYNLMDFGKPGIHLIGDLTFDHKLNETVDPTGTVSKSSMHQLATRMARPIINHFLPKPDIRDLYQKGHQIVANSIWTQEILKDYYQISDIPILYPPVPPVPGNLDSESREPNTFVYIGRISPEKQIQKMIQILSEVRKHHRVKFNIVGEIPNNSYGQSIQSLVAEHSSWITAKGRLVGNEKYRELLSSDFGIQGRENEPFGIAVAEMAQAGCILFHPGNGGQNEILNHEALSFHSDQNAIAKIVKVLQLSSREKEDLRSSVVSLSQRFSIDRFKRDMIHVTSAGETRIAESFQGSVHLKGHHLQKDEDQGVKPLERTSQSIAARLLANPKEQG
tara:strand:- start:1172 stop:2521 length:1350 start_codon:yes stop_codon:yes gene_type:complete